jgi:hypothetical protein
LQDGNVWLLDRETLLQRLNVCCMLNQQYQGQFHVAQSLLKNSNLKGHVSLSNAAIFGKFDEFVGRLNQLQDLFVTVQQCVFITNRATLVHYHAY